MKRSRLIEECNVKDILETVQKRARAITIDESVYKMYRNTVWYKSLLNAEKSCLKADQIMKIHYKFQDGREMVEEYNMDTQVMLRRAWKLQGKLGGEGKWDVEVGDPIPAGTPVIDAIEISESKDQVKNTFCL